VIIDATPEAVREAEALLMAFIRSGERPRPAHVALLHVLLESCERAESAGLASEERPMVARFRLLAETILARGELS
jgi:hypothetical protein